MSHVSSGIVRAAAIASLSLVIAAGVTATHAAGQTSERWDTKLRNAHHFVLKVEDVGVGGRPAFVNGEWQGAFAFELSNCPGQGCVTLSGTMVNSAKSPDDEYAGIYAFPGSACVLRAKTGEDKEGMDDGFVLSLSPTDGAHQGCKAYPAALAGQYEPYWVNHAKMAAQAKAGAH